MSHLAIARTAACSVRGIGRRKRGVQGRLRGNQDAHEHEQGRGLHGAAVTRGGEHFAELAACLPCLLVNVLQVLCRVQHMDICTPARQSANGERPTPKSLDQAGRTEEITSSLEVGVAETTQRLERLRIAALHHVPSCTSGQP